ncbi:MAG TPA: hypothetical protein VGM63_17125 [Mucilaginibacter sp.]|jgi:hypothetical protein
MKRNLPWLFCWVILIVLADSCSKDKVIVKPTTTNSQVTLGLYQYGADSGRRVFVPITKVGTKTVNYLSVFDTGSAGMTIDAHDIIPDAMITSSGFSFTGDSVVVEGITITSKQGIISYGNKTSSTKEYGNLAYASITIGDHNGNTSAKRVPIFLYYKVVDGTTGKAVTLTHTLDVFGVEPGSSAANAAINSPLSYFNTNSDLTNGFKLAALQTNSFGIQPTYVASLLTIGLTSANISSDGFIMHPFSTSNGVVSANIPSTVTYNGQSVSTSILFDTGTPFVSTIENKLAVNATGQLPANTVVTITTNMGFTYTYTTNSTTNLTAVENPSVTGDYRTIFGIDFFTGNEYLTDYTNRQIGLKNN